MVIPTHSGVSASNRMSSGRAVVTLVRVVLLVGDTSSDKDSTLYWEVETNERQPDRLECMGKGTSHVARAPFEESSWAQLVQ